MGKPLVTLSPVIATLQALQAAHGDLAFVLEDPDTGWPMVPDIAYETHEYASGEWDGIGPCVTLSGGYGGTHSPLLPTPEG